LSLGNATDDVMPDGRLVSSRRDALRQIPSVRNGCQLFRYLRKLRC